MSNYCIERLCMLEQDRAKSFKSWPFPSSSKCSAQKMAEAGFYWNGTDSEEDAAACFVCGKVLDGWEDSDEPWDEHRKHAPQCLFVKYVQPEADLTVEQMYNLLEVVAKGKVQNTYKTTKDSFKVFVEKKRKELVKHFSKN